MKRAAVEGGGGGGTVEVKKQKTYPPYPKSSIIELRGEKNAGGVDKQHPFSLLPADQQNVMKELVAAGVAASRAVRHTHGKPFESNNVKNSFVNNFNLQVEPILAEYDAPTIQALKQANDDARL